MTLLITVSAAAASTLIWYSSEKARARKIGILVLMYWGASLMWTVDAVAGFIENGADYFVPSGAEMLNDAFLGLAAAVLGLVIYSAVLLIKDPDGVIADRLRKNERN